MCHWFRVQAPAIGFLASILFLVVSSASGQIPPDLSEPVESEEPAEVEAPVAEEPKEAPAIEETPSAAVVPEKPVPPAAAPPAPAVPQWEEAGADGQVLGSEVALVEEEPEEKSEFVEGELANVGSIGLVPWENRFGITVGFERLGEIFYGVATPQLNYTHDVLGRPLTMSFGVPLRFEVLDSRADIRWSNAGKIRKRDWDEGSDYAQVIRYITYGGKEKHFYLDINAFKSSSVGHGTIVKRYNPNLNLNTRRVSAQLDAFMDYGGFETYINDVTGPNVVGALAFIKPLSIFNRENYMMRSFSIGAQVAADIDAPLRNRLDENDVDGDGRREEEIEVNQDTFQPEYVSSAVVAYGLSVELKLVDTPNVDYKTYGDYSFLESGVPIDDPADHRYVNIPTDAVRSSGITWGHLLRINVGADPVHALRMRAEYRRYDPNYLPSYFDTLYEIQRVQYFGSSSASKDELENSTKLQKVLERKGDQVNGAYFETSWRVSHYLATALGIEWNDQTDDNNLFLHLEVPHIGSWQFLATYNRRNAENLDDLFDFELGGNDVLIVKMRYGFFSWWHMNVEALTPFGIGPESIFRNTVQVNVNAEFGFPY